MSLYENLRTEQINGHTLQEGISTLRFHGMLQGLLILLMVPNKPAPPPTASAPVVLELHRDSEFVRLLANIMLRTHSEIIHVN